jgi:hypothetical protein
MCVDITIYVKQYLDTHQLFTELCTDWPHTLPATYVFNVSPNIMKIKKSGDDFGSLLRKSKCIGDFKNSVSNKLKEHEQIYWILFNLDLPPRLALLDALSTLPNQHTALYSEFANSDLSLRHTRHHNSITHQSIVYENALSLPFTNARIDKYKYFVVTLGTMGCLNTTYIPTTTCLGEYRYVLVVANYNHDNILQKERLKSIKEIANQICNSGVETHQEFFVEPLSRFNRTKSKFDTEIINFLSERDLDIGKTAAHFRTHVGEIEKQIESLKLALECETTHSALYHAREFGYTDPNYQ